MEIDRLNSPSTATIPFEVFHHQLQFCQDPNSKHHGTTVWDSSMVFAKYLEKNCRKGRFSPAKLKGKRVIELGAGCGVAGFGMAFLGCNVVSTDQIEVLPLLRRNVERNVSRIIQTNRDPDSFGSIQVAELDWGNEDHIRAVGPPFDYIIGTDVVYAEHLLEPLLKTILALSGPKTTIIMGYEIRSTSVHEQMLQTWKRYFEVKIVPKTKMDSKYQHSSIQLYIMGLKHSVDSSLKTDTATQAPALPADVLETKGTAPGEEGISGSSKHADNDSDDKVKEDSLQQTRVPEGNLSDWEARRYGSMAARLLRDIKIT